MPARLESKGSGKDVEVRVRASDSFRPGGKFAFSF